MVHCAQNTSYTGHRTPETENGEKQLILLQLSPDHKRAVPARLRAQLLHAAEALEPLWTAALREHDVDLEAVADLFCEGEGGKGGLVRVGDGEERKGDTEG